MIGAPQTITDGGVALAIPGGLRKVSGVAVLTAVSLGGCLPFMSSTLVAVALAAMGRDLDLSSAQLQWLVNAGLLPLAALTLLGGALGDRFGQKRLFVAGIVLFALGTTASVFAPTWEILVAARLVVGVGEALILPNSLSILGQAFPSEAKARVVGIWSAAAAVASALGPALAGAILDHADWRYVFVVPLPVALLGLILTLRTVPEGRTDRQAPADIAGAALSIVGLGGLGFALTRLINGSGVSFATIGAFIVAAVAILALPGVERRLGDRAMLPPALLRSRSVVGANLFTLFVYAPFTVVLTLLPFVLIRSAGVSALVAGLIFIPLQILITVASPAAGAFCRRFGRRAPLFAGAALGACACLLGLLVDGEAAYWSDVFPSVLALAIGMSVLIAPLTTLVLTSVDPDKAGVASGVNSAASRAASLLAVALLGGVLRQEGAALLSAFHLAMWVSAASFIFALLSVFVIAPGPHADWIPRDQNRL